jgi:hypothetical protein
LQRFQNGAIRRQTISLVKAVLSSAQKSSRRFDVIGALVEYLKLSGNSVSRIIAFGSGETPS